MIPHIRIPFLMAWEFECAATARVIGNLPPARLDFQPHPKSMDAGTLAWHLVTSEQWFIDCFLAGRKVPSEAAQRPPSLQEILQAYAAQHQTQSQQVRQAHEDTWTRTLDWFGQGLPAAMLLEGVMLRHAAHHRGQLTVYLRLLGAKVPSVYGPSADEKGGQT